MAIAIEIPGQGVRTGCFHPVSITFTLLMLENKITFDIEHLVQCFHIVAGMRN